MLKQQCNSVPDQLCRGFVTRYYHTDEQIRELCIIKRFLSRWCLEQIANQIFSRSTSPLVDKLYQIVLEFHKVASALYLLLLGERGVKEDRRTIAQHFRCGHVFFRHPDQKESDFKGKGIS